MFLIFDAMRDTRRDINTHHTDPTALARIRVALQRVTDEVRLMHEVLGYLSESLETCEIPPEPLDAAGKALYERLQIADLAGQLSMRVMDLKKNMEAASQELRFLQSAAGHVADAQTRALVTNLETTSRHMVLLHETQQKAASSLEVITLIFAGILAWSILDRLTGPGWQVLDQKALRDFAEPMIQSTPLIWFLLNMLFWALCAYGVHRMLANMVFRSLGKVSVRVRIMQRLRMAEFNAYVGTKLTALEERDFQERNALVRVSWEESDAEAWGGFPPYVQLEYDAQTHFLHAVTMHYNRRDAIKSMALTAPELRNKLCDEMVNARVFEDLTFTFREALPQAATQFGEVAVDVAKPAPAAA
jgi:WD repeat-containing protein 35